MSEIEKQYMVERATAAKTTLKNAGYIQIVPIYTFLYPTDNNEKGRTHIQNVIQGKITDKLVVERLEDMVDQIKDKSR